MGYASKSSSILIVLLLALSIVIMVFPALAQSIPKPSVPEFTFKFLDKSYDVAPTTIPTTDPYNNRTTTNSIPGYHVKDFEIEVAIKNQLFPAIIDGNRTNLYYAVARKGHFENWTNSGDFSSTGSDIYPFFYNIPINSSSEYTITHLNANFYKPGDQVDIEVRAILGYAYSYNVPDHILPAIRTIYVYNSSDWSLTQTFTMPNTSTSPNASTPVFLAVLAITILVATILALIILLKRKQIKGKKD